MAAAALAPPPPPFLGHLWQCAQGPGEVRGLFSEAWWPNLAAAPFLPGDLVAVDLGSNTKHCHAIVQGDAEASAQTSLVADELAAALGRYDARKEGCVARQLQPPACVQLLGANGSYLHVLPEKLVRVLLAEPPRILMVTDTVSMRRLAKTQVGRSDAVLEIGSSLGECTAVLAAHAAKVVGIDVAGELVEECRRRHPHCHFEWLDCFEQPERFRALCGELCAAGSLKVFLDVGGDRTTADVCRVLAALAAAGVSPALIVVKARALAAAAASACDAAGTIVDVPRWWQQVAALDPVGSVRQWKKKLARARKARWEAAGDEDWKAFESYRATWDDVPHEELHALKGEARRLKELQPDAWGETLRLKIGEAAFNTSEVF